MNDDNRENRCQSAEFSKACRPPAAERQVQIARQISALHDALRLIAGCIDSLERGELVDADAVIQRSDAIIEAAEQCLRVLRAENKADLPPDTAANAGGQGAS